MKKEKKTPDKWISWYYFSSCVIFSSHLTALSPNKKKKRKKSPSRPTTQWYCMNKIGPIKFSFYR